jgi:hypothetical protein
MIANQKCFVVHCYEYNSLGAKDLLVGAMIFLQDLNNYKYD